MRTAPWKMIISVLMSLALLVLAWLNREWLVEAISLMREARPAWLLAAFVVICLSYLISSQVFNLILRSIGYRMSMLRIWATALVAIVISQSVPAGGVGSYAFIMTNFNRRGVSPGESALIASLETLSYSVAMLLIFGFSLAYLALHGLSTGGASYIAGLVAISVIAAAVYVLTRREATLRRWFGRLERIGGRLLGRRWNGAWAERLITELCRGRGLMAARRRDVMLLVLVQLTALSGHALAMLLVLYALGASVGFGAVLCAFGIALITSTFNVLPGGGGTVEAALIAVLAQLGAGPAAVPAAIIFRLFNFWLLAPLAAASYHWLMHERAPLLPTIRERRSNFRSSPE